MEFNTEQEQQDKNSSFLYKLFNFIGLFILIVIVFTLIISFLRILINSNIISGDFKILLYRFICTVLILIDYVFNYISDIVSFLISFILELIK